MSRNVRGHFVTQASPWRRAAMAIWRAPNDPTIVGSLQIDASRALDYVRERAAESGERITLTHVVAKALSRALAEHPECNGYVRLGRLFRRETVDVFVLVAATERGDPPASEADLSGIKLERVDQLSVTDIARRMARDVGGLRRGEEREFAAAKSIVRVLPSTLVRWGLSAVTWLQYELNVSLERWGVPQDTFGGALLTNVGAFGIQSANAALVPIARFSLVVTMGRLEDKPVARDGQVVVRPILPITATLDHRVVDGFQAARLARTFEEGLLDPFRYLE